MISEDHEHSASSRAYKKQGEWGLRRSTLPAPWPAVGGWAELVRSRRGDLDPKFLTNPRTRTISSKRPR